MAYPEVHNLTCDFVNSSDSHNMTCYLYTPLTINILNIVYPIILSFGIVNNVLFLLVYMFSQTMHNTTNFYLANLAVADVVFLAYTLGYQTAQLRSYQFDGFATYMQSHAKCSFMSFFSFYTFLVPIVMVTIVTLDRFLAICYPINHKISRGRKRTALLTASGWGIPLILCSSFFLVTVKTICTVWPDAKLADEFDVCSPTYPWLAISVQTFATVVVIVCMISVFMMCWKIIKTLHKRTYRAEQSQLAQQRAFQIRNHVAVMLTVNAIVFFILQTPFQITMTIETVLSVVHGINISSPLETCSTTAWTIWKDTSRIFVYINSSINPIVYNATNPQCRQEYKRVICSFLQKSCQLVCKQCKKKWEQYHDSDHNH